MHDTQFIAAVEAALSAANHSVAAMCRRANIPGSTWHRWKHAGVTPRPRTRAQVIDALRELGVSVPDLPEWDKAA